MVYFRRILVKAYCITAWTILYIIPINTETTTRSPFEKDSISNYLQQYIKPYITPVNAITSKPSLRAKIDKTIEAMIKEKVKKLAPYLQDNTQLPNDDQLRLEGEAETTIIEFIPKNQPAVRDKANSFKENIQKFKTLREKIKKALIKERVTNKTKSLVTTTLDDMIAQMIGHKCNWRGNLVARGGSQYNKTINIGRSAPISIANNWNIMWDNLKKQYLKSEPNSQRKVSPFFSKFQDLISVMTNDFHQVSDRYKIVCHYGDLYDMPKSPRGRRMQSEVNYQAIAEQAALENKLDDNVHCGTNFKICSEELTEFLTDFFNNFNETAINTVRNYAAMFLRDVNDDGHYEKERIVGLIQRSADETKEKVEKAFRKHTNKLELDENKNQYTNIRYLSNYVAKTIEHAKKYIHTLIYNNLDSLNQRLMINIIKDLDVNMNVDLGNLERDINNKICPTFELCNGKPANTRRSDIVGNKHNIYVQVQLDLEEDNKTDSVMRSRDNNITDSKNLTYHNFRFVVTRTPAKVTRTAPKASVKSSIVPESGVKRKMRTMTTNLSYLERMKAKKTDNAIYTHRTKPMQMDDDYGSEEKSSGELKYRTEMIPVNAKVSQISQDLLVTTDNESKEKIYDSSSDSKLNEVEVKRTGFRKTKTPKNIIKTLVYSSKENAENDFNYEKVKSKEMKEKKTNKKDKRTSDSDLKETKPKTTELTTTNSTKKHTKKHKKVTKSSKKKLRHKKEKHSHAKAQQLTIIDDVDTIRVTQAIERRSLTQIGKSWYKKK